jgi:hypothetical protein
MTTEQSTEPLDFSKPLKDRTQEEIARALAAHLRVDRPDAEYDDLLFAARKLITDQAEDEDYYAQ